MKAQKYAVNQHLIENILTWVKSQEIAIPEIQRPFVWDTSKVRDLLDSLYQGYPIGYLIAWKAPNVKLKDGKSSDGKKILIDGQQRVTALTAAVLGEKIVSKDYRKSRIQIAFHPIEQKFEVLNPAIKKDSTWFDDVAPIINGEVGIFKVVDQYCKLNPDADKDLIGKRVDELRNIIKKQIGLIELDSELDIETVTEVFIRINSKGVVLSQADFAMFTGDYVLSQNTSTSTQLKYTAPDGFGVELIFNLKSWLGVGIRYEDVSFGKEQNGAGSPLDLSTKLGLQNTGVIIDAHF